MAINSGGETPITKLISCLNENRYLVDLLFTENRVRATDELRPGLEKLRVHRVVIPDMEPDCFMLRAYIRQCLKVGLNLNQSYQIGADFVQLTDQLQHYITEYLDARNHHHDAREEQYAEEIRTAIGNLADTLNTELDQLTYLVDTQFAGVTTMAEKQRQNEYYLKRIEKLIQMTEILSYSTIGQRLSADQELEERFHRMLRDPLSLTLDRLRKIQKTLSEYLFQYRQIEERTAKMRSYLRKLKREPGWKLSDWTALPHPPQFLMASTPFSLHAGVTLETSADHDLMASIAAKLGSAPVQQHTKKRGMGTLVVSGIESITVVQEISLTRRFLLQYAKVAGNSKEGISAMTWRAKYPRLIAETTPDHWLMLVMGQIHAYAEMKKWNVKLVKTPHPEFNGNAYLHDAIISKGAS